MSTAAAEWSNTLLCGVAALLVATAVASLGGLEIGDVAPAGIHDDALDGTRGGDRLHASRLGERVADGEPRSDIAGRGRVSLARRGSGPPVAARRCRPGRRGGVRAIVAALRIGSRRLARSLQWKMSLTGMPRSLSSRCAASMSLTTS